MTESAFSAPVDGGELLGSVWNAGATGMPVLGLNGITANHRSYLSLGRLLDRPLYSVDQRGRGASRSLPSPYSMVQHADDAARVLDAAGIDRAIIAGHSMGAYIATRLAERHPDRVEALVLIDGGLPLRPTPPDTDPAALLGPAITRLSMTFPDAASYREFWREHPAFGPYWSDAVEDYIDYDLRDIDGVLRPSALPEAVLTNLVELDGRDGYTDAVLELERRGTKRILLTSPRGLFDEVPPLYDAEWLAHWSAQLPGMAVRNVADSNHYTILIGAHAAEVANAIEALAPVEHGKA